MLTAWSAVRLLLAANSSAKTPATCGEAIEVPDIVLYEPLGTVLHTSVPGAEMFFPVWPETL